MSFPKQEDHLVTFYSVVVRTHIDYVFLKKEEEEEEEEENLLVVIVAWVNSGDAINMCDKATSCIREVAREVLRASKGFSSGCRGNW
ncbi:hypothetical protein H5410_006495 [Solanum commersonii]|uniref:Uncharacterized protein n=1 Tax=Solanum commersonii TaxID=4109 RepID=A0A9J6A9I1_SOLCO|nr:hypothetical protein H5410_006495 [Solanum commersonii]